MDNSNSADKSGIVKFSKFSSTTYAAFISLLYVLDQLVHSASWMSVQPFFNSTSFQAALLITPVPYTYINWLWILMGETYTAH